MTKKNTRTISVDGDIYEMNMIQITTDQFKVLTEGKGRDSDVWYELEEELMSDALINGFTYSEDGPNFSIFVDGNEQPGIKNIPVDANVEGSKSSPITQLDTKENIYYLIVEKYSKRARFHLEIEDEFNPANLRLIVDNQELPDGSIQSVVSPYYDDLEFEFDESWPGCEELYILTSENERYIL